MLIIRYSCAKLTGTNTMLNKEQKDGFYGFKSDNESTSENFVNIDTNGYVANSWSNENLPKHPLVIRHFLMYNKALSSSIPVERLFSLEGLVLLPKCHRLFYRRFENLLFMRYILKHFRFLCFVNYCVDYIF